MKHAIITGAAGFVGCHLINKLLSENVKVTALCRKDSPSNERIPKDAQIIYCAMDTYNQLPLLMGNDKPDVFYHLAWEGATGPGRADAELQTFNALRAMEAVKAANAIGCEKFIATGTVYEHFYTQMANATRFFNAAFYIISKRYARDMARQMANKLNIGFTWCTFCHPIGRFIKPEQLMAQVVTKLLNGISPAFGPSEEYFDIIAVEDLAAGLYLAGTQTLPESEYYIGSGDAKPLKEYLLEIPKIIGVDTEVSIGANPDDGMRFKREWFDAKPFSKASGFKTGITFDKAVINVKEYI